MTQRIELVAARPRITLVANYDPQVDPSILAVAPFGHTVPTPNQFAYFNEFGGAALADLTPAARDLLAADSVSAQRDVLELGEAALAVFGQTTGTAARGDDSRFAALTPRGFVDGKITYVSATQVSFSSYQATDFTGVANIKVAAAANREPKTLFGAVGLFDGAGTIVNNSTLHLFAIAKAGGADGTYLSSLSLTPALPPTYAYYRRIASLRLDATQNIRSFYQEDNWFCYTTPVLDVNAINSDNVVMTHALSVPVGIPVIAKLRCVLASISSLSQSGAIYSPNDTYAVTGTNFNLVCSSTQIGSAELQTVTNTSAEVKSLWAAHWQGSLTIVTMAYYDKRGRNDS